VLLTIVAFAIVIGVIVYIHELGHFLAAKLSGVRVERFSMGFGPKLIGFTKGETEYRISVVPFGGYVKMEGEDPEEVKEIQMGDRYGSEWGFLGKTKRTRAFIVAAGPAMNFILAMLMYTFLTAHVGVGIITTRQIGEVIDGTPASEAGLAEGDLIVSVDGIEVETWGDMVDLLRVRLGEMTDIVVERDGVLWTNTLDLTSVGSVYETGISPFRAPVVGEVKRGGPAHAAGLQAGDRIVRIGGTEILTWNDLNEVIRSSPNKELGIEWERDGERFASTVRPLDADGYGLIEIYSSIETRRVGLLESFKVGLETTVWVAKQLFMLPHLISRGTAIKDVIGGPVKIGELAGESIRWGLLTFLGFIAAVNAQLCLLNLLPIPPLDGGHLIILGAEGISRRSMTLRQRMIVQQIGFVFLVTVMVLITLLDVSRFVK
jgi:regulator of sigma E protease